jgi:cytochrome c553
MSPLRDLDDKDLVDLAAYYGALTRGAIDPAHLAVFFVGAEIENLVTNGDFARGLPCISCHGTRAGGPIETPTLTGQYAEYLEAQLQAFASGATNKRHLSSYAKHRIAAEAGRDEAVGIYYSGR